MGVPGPTPTDGSVRLRLDRLTSAQRSLLRSRLRGAATTAIPHRDPARPIPATAAQARLWFLQQYAPQACAYHSAYRLRLQGPLDAGLLERGWQGVVERHEVLRGGLVMQEGLLELRIAASLDVTLPVRDAREDEVPGLALALARRPFELCCPPLWRAALVRTGPQVHELLLVLHHAITDRWSLGVLLRDLDLALSALAAGGAPAWAPLPLAYGDYAAWEHEWLERPECTAQVEYWREALRGAPQVLDLPIAAARPAAQTWRGAVHRVSLPPAVAERVVQRAAEQQATPYMLLLAALAAVLARYTGRDDFVLGSPLAQRQRPELESLAGILLNTLPLRVRVPADTPFTAVVDDLRCRLPEAYAHAGVPFEALVERLGVARDPSRPPLVQVVCNLHNVPPLPGRLGPVALACHDVDLGAAKLDLTVTLRCETAGLKVACEYNADLFAADAVERLVGHFGTLLQAALERPDTAVAALPLLDAGERRRVVESFNAPAALPPAVPELLEMLQEQVRSRPEAPAVADGTTTLTYAQLEARTRALALRLRAQGASPGARVAV
ncbi:MAG: condensation domain-containing protein, partial [Candidatus Latescibacterota bacterium]